MNHDVSLLRLYALRLVYAMNFVFLGMNVWPGLLDHPEPWDPVKGVAMSFWAALSLLSALGLRYPLKMLPVLMMQLTYKVVWLAFVGYPLWTAGNMSSGATAIFNACAIGFVIDLVVIPWPYVVKRLVRAPGERWRVARAPSAT